MKHDKSLIRNLIHEFGGIGNVKVNKFLFVEIDPDGIDQLNN